MDLFDLGYSKDDIIDYLIDLGLYSDDSLLNQKW